MTFDLVQHVKARTRSVHFDRSLLFMATTPLAESSPKASRDSKRTISFPLSQDDKIPSPSSPRPSTVRHYRSMLDVDQDPPTLSPMKSMSFDELYLYSVTSGPAVDERMDLVKPNRDHLTIEASTQGNPRNTSSECSPSQAPPCVSTSGSIIFSTNDCIGR
jgi:septin 7